MGKPKRFLHDLARGNNAEQLVASLLTSAGFDSAPDKDARIKWDVLTEYGQSKIPTEVKFDEYENRSGNIALEVWNPRSNKPSGITATEAFFWAHVLVDNVVWMTTVAGLKGYMDISKPSRIIDRGGDNNATIWLYPSDQILEGAFTRIDTMTQDELSAFVIQHWEDAQCTK